MLVLGRGRRSWQWIWRQPGALTRGLRVEGSKSAFENPYERRIEDIGRAHGVRKMMEGELQIYFIKGRRAKNGDRAGAGRIL